MNVFLGQGVKPRQGATYKVQTKVLRLDSLDLLLLGLHDVRLDQVRMLISAKSVASVSQDYGMLTSEAYRGSGCVNGGVSAILSNVE